MSQGPYYIATQKFDAECGEEWTSYIRWCGLTQLREVVSFDNMLCSVVLPTLKEEVYWEHIVNEDYLLDFFTNLDFMLSEIDDLNRVNILAVLRNPGETDHRDRAPTGFHFLGYDLVDQDHGTSALTNCGGFPGVFSNDEINAAGLLDDHRRAVEIRDALRVAHPEERHADCNVWAIYRRQ